MEGVKKVMNICLIYGMFEIKNICSVFVSIRISCEV